MVEEGQLHLNSIRCVLFSSLDCHMVVIPSLVEDTTSDEPVDSSLSAKSLGKRAYLPMEVTSFVAGTGEGQSDGGATLEVPGQLPFTSGVPAVGTVKGLLHLFKER